MIIRILIRPDWLTPTRDSFSGAKRTRFAIGSSENLLILASRSNVSSSVAPDHARIIPRRRLPPPATSASVNPLVNGVGQIRYYSLLSLSLFLSNWASYVNWYATISYCILLEGLLFAMCWILWWLVGRKGHLCWSCENVLFWFWICND